MQAPWKDLVWAPLPSQPPSHSLLPLPRSSSLPSPQNPSLEVTGTPHESLCLNYMPRPLWVFFTLLGSILCPHSCTFLKDTHLAPESHGWDPPSPDSHSPSPQGVTLALSIPLSPHVHPSGSPTFKAHQD